MPLTHWWQSFVQVLRRPFSPNLLIAQVSDMHISATDAPYRGIHVRQQFEQVLIQLEQQPLDLLVLSGDLAAVAGEAEAYEWLKTRLEHFPHPYVLMAGNHDHVGRMMEIFKLSTSDLTTGMLCFTRRLKGRLLIFLDSSSNYIPAQQLLWLQEQLASSREEVLLFMHHPPVFGNCRFMDTYHPLRNLDEVWSILQQLPQIKTIFCGHYHTEKTILREGKTVHLTPSTVFQIDTQYPKFQMSSTQPGWRIIEWQGERLNTHVKYLGQ